MASIGNIARVAEALRKAAAAKQAALTTGLQRAGLYLQAKSEEIVPVDYEKLKISSFTRLEGTKNHPIVTVGYTANYAVYVHEDLDKAHGAVFNQKYAAELAEAAALRKKRKGGTTGPFRHERGANQQAKFLEMPLRRDRKILAQIVSDEVAEA